MKIQWQSMDTKPQFGQRCLVKFGSHIAVATYEPAETTRSGYVEGFELATDWISGYEWETDYKRQWRRYDGTLTAPSDLTIEAWCPLEE